MKNKIWEDALNEIDMSNLPEPDVPFTDEQKEALKSELSNLISKLPAPFPSNIWEDEITDLQSQIRTCLITEIVSRYVDDIKVPTSSLTMVCDTFDSNAKENLIGLAIIFPVTMMFVIKNHLKPPKNATPPNTIIPGEMFTTELFSQMVEQHKYKKGKFTCSMIHHFIDAALDKIDVTGWIDEVSQEIDVATELITDVTLNTMYVPHLGGAFRDGVTNTQILILIEIFVKIASNLYDHIEQQF
jgi:hypothetical protein